MLLKENEKKIDEMSIRINAIFIRYLHIFAYIIAGMKTITLVIKKSNS
ncbi:hypothetical protein KZO01_27720 [Kurthia zopfii]|nr:hypothetical protein KZO01_27720 [Kurthia zopfii]